MFADEFSEDGVSKNACNWWQKKWGWYILLTWLYLFILNDLAHSFFCNLHSWSQFFLCNERHYLTIKVWFKILCFSDEAKEGELKDLNPPIKQRGL